MLRMGYLVTDPGALDRVGSTPRRALGVRRAAIMQKLLGSRQFYRVTAQGFR